MHAWRIVVTVVATALVAVALVSAGCGKTEETAPDWTPPATVGSPDAAQPSAPVPPAEPETESPPEADSASATEAPEGDGAAGGKTVTTASGLQYIIEKEGTGPEAVAGKTVFVHYTGTLKATGEKFDCSVHRGPPIDFVLGTGMVIPGWDEGITGMKVGEKRRLIIPAALGYGASGSPPAIPPNADLVFETELMEVR